MRLGELFVASEASCGTLEEVQRAHQWMRDHPELGPFAPLVCDDEGRVVVPSSPSPGDMFWRDPGGEVEEATGRVASGTGRVVGGFVGALLGQTAASVVSNTVASLGPWLWVGLAVAGVVLVSKR